MKRARKSIALLMLLIILFGQPTAAFGALTKTENVQSLEWVELAAAEDATLRSSRFWKPAGKACFP